MRLFQLEPLSAFAILALLLVLSAPFENSKTISDHASRPHPSAAQARGAVASSATPLVEAQKGIESMNTSR